MQTFIDRTEFVDRVMGRATEQGWDLSLKHCGAAMRYVWQWTWKGQHPLPERSSMFPGEAEAKFAACLELVTQAGWAMELAPGVAAPMELEQPKPPPGLADVVPPEDAA